MNGARLLLSLMLVASAAAVLPAVRSTRRPRAWALVLAVSLGAGFVLLEASLIHASLPFAFDMLGLDRLAAACRALGGHLFGGAAPFGAFAGVFALVIGLQAMRGVSATVRAHSALRHGASGMPSTAIAGYETAFLPLSHRWAVAIPGGSPQVLLSPSLVGALRHRELDAIVRHEMAHLHHRHVRFLLLGTAVRSGLWFLPWIERATTALRLALERWADETAASSSSEDRASVRSALHKLASIAPSALASYRINALETPPMEAVGRREWGWSTAASGTVPLALALAVTLVLHILQVVAVAAGA